MKISTLVSFVGLVGSIGAMPQPILDDDHFASKKEKLEKAGERDQPMFSYKGSDVDGSNRIEWGSKQLDDQVVAGTIGIPIMEAIKQNQEDNKSNDKESSDSDSEESHLKKPKPLRKLHKGNGHRKHHHKGFRKHHKGGRKHRKAPIDEYAIVRFFKSIFGNRKGRPVTEHGCMRNSASKKQHAMSKAAYEKLPSVDSEELQDLIGESALRSKAKSLYHSALRSIRKYGHPTRVIDSPGHWSTIQYIENKLRALKGYYDVSTQAFSAIDGRVESYSLLINGLQPKSLSALELSPPTLNKRPVHGKLVLVKNLGCSLEDFPVDSKGNIVLIKRGECPYEEKSVNAGISGALGAIIYDDEVPLHGTLGTPTGKEVATVSVSETEVKKYIDELTLNPFIHFETTLYVDSYYKKFKTLNVIAESVYGDHDNVVSLGAHSDSVEKGPGINDDGSGTISLLEVAEQLSKFQVKNAVRFAFWAAEEEGLLGSTFYADSLSPEENAKIRLFMDYDMMASPNYEYQVYDANNEDHPNGSGDLKDLYINWYKDHGLNYTLVPFDGRSDYVGFIDNGIPAGGIATGAEGIKTKDGQEKYGGKAGQQLDPCYHEACDNLENPDYEAWVLNTKLIAHTVATYAKSFEGFPERELSNASVSSFRPSDKFAYRGSRLIF